MTKREMAEEYSERAARLRASSGKEAFTKEAELNDAAAAALLREAEAEEKARPKVTLEQQEKAIRMYVQEQRRFHNLDGVCRHEAYGNCNHAETGAATLRLLREDGGKLLNDWHRNSFSVTELFARSHDLLRKLGVEPTP